MLHIKRTCAVAGATIALTVAFVNPAAADIPIDSVNEVVEALEAAPDLGEIATPTVQTSGDLAATTDDGAVVTIPTSGDGTVDINAPGMALLSLGLPSVDTKSAEVAADGTVVYASADATSAGMAVEVLDEGTVSIQTVIGSASGRHSFTYTLATDTVPMLRADGGVDLVVSVSDGAQVVVGAVETPWAVDANGAPVNTRYVVSGSTFTQIVEPGPATVYPVVADPTYGHTYGMPTIYLNKAETRTAAGDIGGVYLICSAVALFSPYLSFMCEANAYLINRGAKAAKAANACVKIVVGPLVVAALTYTANCR